jgi:hypothetical protein
MMFLMLLVLVIVAMVLVIVVTHDISPFHGAEISREQKRFKPVERTTTRGGTCMALPRRVPEATGIYS